MNNLTINHRFTNLELYRIIVMLLIIAHHYVVNTGIMGLMEKDPLSMKSIFFYIFGMWGKTGINCFVLITGYFMCKSNISVRKILKLILEVEFYNIGIFLIFSILNHQLFSFRNLILCILPVKSVTDSFVSCFLVFYLCIPFLNILITHLDKKQHLCLLSLSLGIYTVLGTLPGIEVRMNYVSWFCTLYFVASYIRFYGEKYKGHVKGGYLMASILLSVASVIGALYVNKNTGMHIGCYRYVSDCNMIFAVTTAITSFMYFKQLKIGYHKSINLIAQSVFGVLLIHANSDFLRDWLWRQLLAVQNMFYSKDACIYASVCVMGIFMICSLIDRLRICTFEKWTFKYIDRILKNK